jgi:hypothetical protein
MCDDDSAGRRGWVEASPVQDIEIAKPSPAPPYIRKRGIPKIANGAILRCNEEERAKEPDEFALRQWRTLVRMVRDMQERYGFKLEDAEMR